MLFVYESKCSSSISTDSNTSINLESLGSPGPDALVEQGVIIDVTNGSAVFGQNQTWSLENNGTLISTDTNSHAVQLQNGTFFRNNGLVSGTGGGIYFY